MLKKGLQTIFTIAVLITGITSAVGADLKFSFIQDSTAAYLVSIDSVQIISREGQDLPETVSYVQEYEITNRVTADLGSGQGRVETMIDSINATLSRSNVNIEYDSTTDATPAQEFLTLAALVGESYETDLTEKGQVLALSGIEEIQDKIYAADPSLQLQPNYDLDELENSITNTTSVQLPAGDVTPGATWVTTFEIPTPLTGSMAASATFEYVADETVAGLNCAKIEFETAAKTMDDPDPQSSFNIGASSVETVNTVELSGTGTLYLALSEGILVKLDWSGTLLTTSLNTMLTGAGSQSVQTVTETEIQHTLDLQDRS
jgi:hypothetical protein